MDLCVDQDFVITVKEWKVDTNILLCSADFTTVIGYHLPVFVGLQVYKLKL